MRGLLIFVVCLTFFSPILQAEEISLARLEKAALVYAGLDPQQLSHWRSKLKWSALLPRVGVGYDQKAATQINNTIQDSVSVSSSGVTVGPPGTTLHQDDNLNRGFEVKASWDLSELVFNRNSLAIAAESRYQTVVRSQIIEELHQSYFERKKLLFKPENLSALQKLRLEELEAKLNALTGGIFSKLLESVKEES